VPVLRGGGPAQQGVDVGGLRQTVLPRGMLAHRQHPSKNPLPAGEGRRPGRTHLGRGEVLPHGGGVPAGGVRHGHQPPHHSRPQGVQGRRDVGAPGPPEGRRSGGGHPSGRGRDSPRNPADQDGPQAGNLHRVPPHGHRVRGPGGRDRGGDRAAGAPGHRPGGREPATAEAIPMFDALRYLKDTGVPFAEAGHPKVTAGWVGISCPFCRDAGVHGGFSLEKGFYNCWVCGWHDVVDVIAALERIKPHEAVLRHAEYEISSTPIPTPRVREKKTGSATLPPEAGPLTSIHQAYLKKRGFDPDFLEEKYQLKGTGPVGSYKFRIIAPIYLDGRLISFQGRDVTGKSIIPYKACPKEREAVEHKDTLYNVDNARGTVIVVEGIFDVWRLGDGAVATFGIGFRWTQVDMLASRFHQVFLLYDGEPKAQAQAQKIVNALNCLGVKAENILLNHGDPAEMTPEDAKRLKEDLYG
jgi:hypothetical protein